MARRTTTTNPASAITPAAPANGAAGPVVTAHRATASHPIHCLPNLDAKDTARGVDQLLSSEWLLTNGLGGFAMGTAAGVPQRRYHGLLIAATRPPVGRVMVLNAVADQLIVEPESSKALTIDLSGFRFAGLGDKIHPDGPTRIESFTEGTEATWIFTTPAARITKAVHLLREANAVAIEYTIERTDTKAKSPLRLTARPLTSLRDFHSLIRRAWADRFSIKDVQSRSATIERDGLSVRLRSDTGSFSTDPQWWHDFLYSEEAARQQDCVEDLFAPCVFTIDLAPGDSAARMIVRAGLEDSGGSLRDELENNRALRSSRTASLSSKALATLRSGTVEPIRRAISALAVASDDFVVARRDGTGSAKAGASVIAGYPWFGDWGRDTFVSLPGLMLTTGRFDEARETLRVFAAHRRRGLIPNVFNEQTGEPEYNTVDAPLWFIHSACAFAEAGGDRAFWKSDLAPACLDIVSSFRKGTGGESNIAMDPFDKLITAGTSATQLTWMDARRDGVVFTPRHGKTVEINALWISALKRVAALLGSDDPHTAANFNDLADAAAKSFRKSFWNAAGGDGVVSCCFDCLTPSDSDAGPVVWKPDAAIRPNQIFAVSLPHSPLAPDQQRAVVKAVRDRLYTPRGLRTLDPVDSRYQGRYEGNLFQRDSAYHNGTAWPWLLGPLAEAVLRADNFSASARDESRAILAPMLNTLTASTPERGGCLGQLAEIYDGDQPQRPQGCVAQAWSVAELLRVACMIAS